MASSIKMLQTKEQFCDVTLVSDEQIPIPAHKIVLSACSPYFRNILVNNNHPHPLIYLRGVKLTELSSIMAFIYTGEAAIFQDSINDFLEVAKDLEISCEESIIQDSDASLENVKEIEDIKEILNKSEKSDPYRLVCKDCNVEFQSQQGLKYHIRSKHGGIRYPCDRCEYQAKHPSHLKVHKQSLHDGARFSCTQCTYFGKRQDSLRAHIKLKHTIEENNQSNVDSPKIEDNSNISKNQENKSDSLVETVSEPVCVITTFKEEENNEQVKNDEPKKITSYDCLDCDISFRSKQGLKYHIGTKHGDLRFSCDRCDYQAKHPSHLKTHRNSQHEGVKYSCNQCEYEASRQDLLKVHKQTKHEGVTFSCDQCTYQGTQQENLVTHQRVKHGRCK